MVMHDLCKFTIGHVLLCDLCLALLVLLVSY